MPQTEYAAHVVVEGRGRPVVLVHGVLVDHSMWDPQVKHLAGDHRVIRYDLLGHGRSSNPPGERTLNDFVRQLRLVIAQHCPGERPVVIGFSMGGLIAQAFAIEHSDQLAGLVIMNAVYNRTPQERAAVGLRLDAFEHEGIESVIEAAITRWFTKTEQQRQAHTIASIIRLMREGDQAAKIKAYRVFATQDADTAGRLGNITCPALVMTGDSDTGSPPHMSENMVREIPHAELHVLTDQRHMMPTLASGIVNQRLRNFISNL